VSVPLQQFGINDSPYERPNQKWVCGWAADGRPCAVGPDGRGRCTAAAQALCEPRRGDSQRDESPDRWYCARPIPFGGPCEAGPLPDGSCCRPRPEHLVCQPRLSLRARRGRLTLACTALAIGLLALLLTGPWGLWYISPGPLTAAHQTMEGLHGGTQSCALCHEQNPDRGPLVQPVSDTACLQCHMAEAHYPHRSLRSGISFSKPEWPGELRAADRCFQCHDEHRGRDHDLIRLSDQQCVQCHGNLTEWVRRDTPSRTSEAGGTSGHPTANSRSPTAPEIHAFDADHPDWGILRSGEIDRTPIRFEHHVHMNPETGKMPERLAKWMQGLSPQQQADAVRRAPAGGLSLACSACHQADATGRYMKPIRFDQHCVQCHDLGSKAEIPVPHGHQVRDFIPNVAARILSRPPEKPKTASGGRGGPRKRGPRSKPSTPKPIEFQSPEELAKHFDVKLQEQVAKLNRSLRNTCGKCHDPDSAPSEMPNPRIPDRWLTQSRFDHAAHRFASCAQCHAQAVAEKPGTLDATAVSTDPELKWTGRTKQIMIPSIASCRQCHAQPSTARVGGRHIAANRCTTCHLYHSPRGHLAIDKPLARD